MVIFVCPKRTFQTVKTLNGGNSYLHFNDLNQHGNSKKVTLCQIVEFVFMFVLKLPTEMVMNQTRSSEVS